MTHRSIGRSIRVLAVAALLVGVLAAPLPALAQEEQRSAEQRLKAVDQEEAVGVMRAAVEYVHRNIEGRDGEPLTQNGRYPADSIKIDPAGLLSGPFSAHPTPLPEKARRLAEGLAAALSADVGSSEEGHVAGVYVATSVPEIRGAEARVDVRRLTAFEDQQLGVRRQALKLERGAGGSWQVAEELRTAIN